MKYARRAARWLTLFSAASPWTGATWATNGGGQAYNTPTLGSEALTDGGLENWSSATDLTSWTEGLGGTSTVNRESSQHRSGTFGARLDIDSSNSTCLIRQPGTFTAGIWYLFTFYAKASTTGKSIQIRNVDDALFSIGTITTTYAQYVHSARGIGATVTGPLVSKLSAASSSLYFDDLSIKALTLSQCFATVNGSATDLTGAAKITAASAATGVVSLLDSASSPANFLIGYHDGINAKLDKCVGGTYTNLVSTAVAFSSGAQIEIRRPSGNTFQLWYNGSQRGTDQTVSDAGIISNTRYGLFSTYSGNLFSEFSLAGVVIPLVFPGA